MFPSSSNAAFEDSRIFLELEDLLADCPISDGNNTEKKSVKKRSRKIEVSNNGSSESKKTAHRFTEKQRRQEMAALYASLRSLLPPEYIKGKRAISDHMHQAVNYINDMKNKIKQMKLRRNSFGVEAENQTSNASDSSPYCVKINPLTEGFEILISSSLNKGCFPLSMVLADLLNRQLHVISCVSTRGDGCYLHKIHLELNDSASIDLSELQDGLVNMLKLV
ncbi:transcription factor bHLH36-like isoform X2 [Salvia hispanica]|uniref:transcription factor bHLH36-like isoform X2 n=1 Tax=Salvia hispanica TaxID=49212 RepID=UPI0020095423|nr:transcription factor bHLH36-like isoform X2 [Salvia hispanica]